MKRNKKIQANLNTTEFQELSKINKNKFNNLPLSVLVRILLNESIRIHKIK